MTSLHLSETPGPEMLPVPPRAVRLRFRGGDSRPDLASFSKEEKNAFPLTGPHTFDHCFFLSRTSVRVQESQLNSGGLC